MLVNDPSSDDHFRLDLAPGDVIQETKITVKATYPVLDPNTGANFQQEKTFTAKQHPCDGLILDPVSIPDIEIVVGESS